MFNAAFLSAPIEHQHVLEQRILLAAAHFQTRGLPWAFWVAEDFIHTSIRRRSRKTFEKYGLRHSVDLPGMLAPVIFEPTRHLPPLDVHRVTPGPTRDAFCALGSLCFNVPPPWFLEVFEAGPIWNDFAAFVGYAEEEPVATAAVVPAGNVLGVYNVATSPLHRHRGYAESIVRQAVDHFPASPVILQSTPAGLRLYQRMGFKTITTIAVYSTR